MAAEDIHLMEHAWVLELAASADTTRLSTGHDRTEVAGMDAEVVVLEAWGRLVAVDAFGGSHCTMVVDNAARRREAYGR